MNIYASRTSPEWVDREIARVAAAQHGVISRAQALAAGATNPMVAWRVKVGRFVRLRPGVYALGGVPPSWHREVMAICLTRGTPTASHRTAGALLELAGMPHGLLEVTFAPGSRREYRGVITHALHLTPDETTVLDGIPVTTPRRTTRTWPPSYPPMRSTKRSMTPSGGGSHRSPS